MSAVTEVSRGRDVQRVSELVDGVLAGYDPRTTPDRTLLGSLFDVGLAWIHFPVGHGGLELSPALQALVNDRVAAAGGPDPEAQNPLGHGMAAPTIVAHGTEEQKDRYLRPLFTGEEIWCQLFSEPGAGSDVAGLATRAVRDGDEWLVNGQKVWTTLAHIARWGILVARTDPGQPKHRGLTYFLLDMRSPGIEVRPLRQITGEAEFNEVYMTDVRVPDSARLGGVGDGWRATVTTLMNERVSIGGSIPPQGSGSIGEAVELWKQLTADHRSQAIKDQLMTLWVEAEVNRLTNVRAAQNRKIGTPGPEGSIGKVAFAELNKRIYEFCMHLMGAEGMLYKSYEMIRPDTASSSDTLQKAFLRARANSIEGGTTEIMRNILGERVLGLPGDVRVDKDPPWSEVPRS